MYWKRNTAVQRSLLDVSPLFFLTEFTPDSLYLPVDKLVDILVDSLWGRACLVLRKTLDRLWLGRENLFIKIHNNKIIVSRGGVSAGVQTPGVSLQVLQAL